MIPVQLQPEPEDFDATVRIPGRRYLQKHPNPEASDIMAFWQGPILKELWDAYKGVCAYLCIFMEYTTGASSVDHLVPKSRDLQKAYEWDNYRLACLGVNRKKGTRCVLDPIGLCPESFFINFSDGRIYPNPSLKKCYKAKCKVTIKNLDLDSSDNREMRCRHFDEYRNKNVTLQYLHEKSPFVYYEIIRQGLQ